MAIRVVPICGVNAPTLGGIVQQLEFVTHDGDKPQFMPCQQLEDHEADLDRVVFGVEVQGSPFALGVQRRHTFEIGVSQQVSAQVSQICGQRIHISALQLAFNEKARAAVYGYNHLATFSKQRRIARLVYKPGGNRVSLARDAGAR